MIFNIQIDKTAPGGLFHALLNAWPKYAAYVASFLTIGVMLMNHHGMFTRLARLDRPLIFLNLLLLMVIVFLPFSTAQLGSNILVAEDAKTAATLYAINSFAIAVGFGAVWTYAVLHPSLLAPEVDRQAALRAWPRFSVGNVVYLVCIPLAQFSPIAVIIVCALLAVYYTFENLPDIMRHPTRVV